MRTTNHPHTEKNETEISPHTAYSPNEVDIIGTVPSINLDIPVTLGVEKKQIQSLIDTGTNPNIVKTDSLPPECRIGRKTRPVCAASPSRPLKYRGDTTIQITINGHKFRLKAKVVDDIQSDLILGMSFLHKHDVTPRAKEGVVEFRKNNFSIKMNAEYIEHLKNDNEEEDEFIREYDLETLALGQQAPEAIGELHEGNEEDEDTRPPPERIQTHVTKNKETAKHFEGHEDVTDPGGVVIPVSKKLPTEQRAKALQLIHRFRNVFSTKDDETGLCVTQPYKIRLKDDTPVCVRPFNASYKEREKVREFLKDLEKAQIIEKGRGEYCSPAFFRFKKNGRPRLLVDYSELNKKIYDDHNAAPRIDTILEALVKARYFSSMDLSHSFYQFPLDEASRECTGFRLDSTMLYQFRRLPQGLKISAAASSRAIFDIFEDILYKGLTAYLDDMCCYGVTFEEQFKNLEEVLTRLERHNLRLNTEKCSFFEPQTELLGHVIKSGKITPNPKNIEKFLALSPPKTVKDVRGLISSFGFYRKFMGGFVNTAKPIMDLVSDTGKQPPSTKITWTEECQEAFDKLKKQITSPPVLAIFNPKFKTYLQTDASSYAVGAVLSQEDPLTNEIKPVGFYSEKMPTRKRHLSSYDLELIAICKALKHFRQYVYMMPLTVLTDHKNLTHPKITENSLTNPARIRRITDILSQFEIKFVHISAKNNALPDLLSRGPEFERIHNVVAVLKQNKLAAAQDEDKETKGLKIAIRDEDFGDQYTEEEIARLRKISRRHSIDENDVLLCKKFNRGKQLRIPVIPPKMRKTLIEEAHDSPQKGIHTGEARTFLKLANLVFWPGMRKEIIEYVKSCDTCQRIKKSKTKYGKINKHTFEEKLMQKLCTDVCGPFNVNNQKIYILSMIDAYSKFIFMRATKVVNTQTVISLLHDIITTFPVPKKLFTDQATYFMSRELETYTQELGITLRHSIPYTPSNNSIIERSNHWLSTSIKALLKDKAIAASLVNGTKLIQRAWNTSPNPSLDMKSPQYVMFGVEDDYLSNKYDIPSTTNQTREEEIKTLNEFRKKIPEILQKNFEVYSKYHNKDRKDLYLKEKDKIMWEVPFPTKMQDKYTGPYEITKILGPSSFIINKDGEEKTVHISKIKKYRERSTEQ